MEITSASGVAVRGKGKGFACQEKVERQGLHRAPPPYRRND